MRRNVFKRATAALLGATAITFAAPAVTATATTPPATQATNLPSGHTLMPGQSIISGETELLMQPDGNLVLYLNNDSGRHGPALWASGTYGNPGAYAYMQPDGNFVVYRQNGGPDSGGALWSTGTWGHPDAVISLLNGELGLGGPGGYWQTLLRFGPEAGGANDRFGPLPSTLDGHRWIESNSVWLVMQADGNLVLYRKRDGAALWSTGTYGHLGKYTYATASGSADENALQVFELDTGSSRLWSIPLKGRPGDYAKVQDDGNFVLYGSDGTARWSTGTWGNW
ncbi:hypothetical protein ACFYST_17605 [Kitasatospora sp. NPDC004614]|uniref:hypothetical protein n=1 Tax=unclassified Kitasatospora TaxID=2633591 RepID=UPI0036A4A79E